MPHVNLYIREEDWEAFQAIQNRPEWLHRAVHAAKASDLEEEVTEVPDEEKTLHS